jgi:hypothetical protein
LPCLLTPPSHHSHLGIPTRHTLCTQDQRPRLEIPTTLLDSRKADEDSREFHLGFLEERADLGGGGEVCYLFEQSEREREEERRGLVEVEERAFKCAVEPDSRFPIPKGELVDPE